MKQKQIKVLMAAGLSACISLAGISPAAAVPVPAGVSTVKPFVAPVVTIYALPNSTASNKTAKRLLRPSYKVGSGATLVSTRLTVLTVAGKVITPSATSVNVLPGSYRVTTTIRYTYKQSGKTVTKTISKAQNLAVGVAKPVPATGITVDVFNRLDALRQKKGLPALKNNATFTAFVTAREKNNQTNDSPFGRLAGLDQFAGPSAYGGSSVDLPKWVVTDMMNQAWFRARLYDPSFNTLAVTTQFSGWKKEVHFYFAHISAPGPVPVPVPVPTVKPSPLTAADVFGRLNALRVKKGLPALKSNPAFNAYVAAGGSSINPTKWPPGMGSSMTTGVGGSNVGSAANVVAELFDRGFPDLYDTDYNTLSVTVSCIKGENLIYVGLAHIFAPM